MCSGKVPGDSNPSRNIPEDKPKPSIPPQIPRSSIPATTVSESAGIQKMVSSVKAEKRKIEDLESKKTPIPAELHEQVFNCFREKTQHIDDLEGLASFCFEAAMHRFQSAEYVTTDEIIFMNALFFETLLKTFSEKVIFTNQDLRAPHSVYVIKSLRECLETLSGYTTFQHAIVERDKYLTQHPALAVYLGKDLPTRGRLLPMILKSAPDFQSVINNCPVYSTNNLLGSNNIHAAYVLRDSKFQPYWIFKPTIQHPASIELMHTTPDNPLRRSVREQAASQLNFHFKFPIPATFLVEIKGSVGSVQLFIDKANTKLDGSNSHLMSKEDLQAETVE